MGLHAVLHFMKLATNQRNKNRNILKWFINIIYTTVLGKLLSSKNGQDSLIDFSNKHDFHTYHVLCHNLEIQKRKRDE